jgi:hypothetical protein
MYELHCEIESCLHNLNNNCFCPEKVFLKKKQFLFNSVVMKCDKYVDKDQKLLAEAIQDKVPCV